MAVSRLVALLLGLLLFPRAAVPQPIEPPSLIVEAPPALAPVAARLRAIDPHQLVSTMRLVGLSRPGPPIRVIVAPEGSGPAVLVSPWVAGYSLSDQGL